MDKTTLYWTRWLCLPIVLLAIPFYLCLGIHFAGLNVFHFYGKSVSGFLSAVLWVLSAYSIAPDRKIRTALATLVIGTILSWFLIGETNLPDYSGMTRMPIYITWSAGIIAFASAFIAHERILRLSSTNNTTNYEHANEVDISK